MPDWTGAAESNVIEITVYDPFTPGAIETTGETICYGGDPAEIGSITDASGGDGNITYQWQSSSDPSFTSPITIPHNYPTYDPPAGLTVTTWFHRLAKDKTCNTTFTPSSGVWQVTVHEQLIITCPHNINTNSDPELCTALVGFAATYTGTPTPIETYAIGGTIPITSSYAFPIGSTSVKATASHYYGTVECWFNVTVTDNQPPIVLTKDIIIYLDVNVQATITPDLINNGSTENCGIASMQLSKTSFTPAHIGQNIITLTITDIHNNHNAANANVTVDNLPEGWKKCDTHPSGNGLENFNFNTSNPVFYLQSGGLSTLTNDVFHFVYQEVCASKFTIIARIDQITKESWSGLMVYY